MWVNDRILRSGNRLTRALVRRLVERIPLHCFASGSKDGFDEFGLRGELWGLCASHVEDCLLSTPESHLPTCQIVVAPAGPLVSVLASVTSHPFLRALPAPCCCQASSPFGSFHVHLWSATSLLNPVNSFFRFFAFCDCVQDVTPGNSLPLSSFAFHHALAVHRRRPISLPNPCYFGGMHSLDKHEPASLIVKNLSFTKGMPTPPPMRRPTQAENPTDRFQTDFGMVFRGASIARRSVGR